MGKVETRDADIVRIKLSEMLDEIRPFIKSITGDNGKEGSIQNSVSLDFQI
jgi:IS30 family transposase